MVTSDAIDLQKKLMSDIDREIALTGAKNFRDFGGYPTRDGRTVSRGKLFRAGMLSGLIDDDLIRLSALTIRTICDLRRSRERQASPTRWCNSDVNSLHLPLLLDSAPGNTGTILADARRLNSAEASRELMKTSYRNMVSDPHALAQMRRLFELITEPQNLPLLLHCSGGKDRTGVCCALLLTLLDVDEIWVMQDYMRSLALFTRRMSETDRTSQVVALEHSQAVEEALQPVYTVEPAYLLSAFAAIEERHATIDRFFERDLGITRKQIESIKTNLLD